MIGNRDGLISELLNTTSEVHAAVYGIYAGITEWKGVDMPDDPDVNIEPHYYKGGYILGTFIRWGAILLLGSAVL